MKIACDPIDFHGIRRANRVFTLIACYKVTLFVIPTKVAIQRRWVSASAGMTAKKKVLIPRYPELAAGRFIH
jgi:hypothetical protein